MNLETFRTHLKSTLGAPGMSQSELSKRSGVDQCNISKFLKGGRDMKLSMALKLWPYVYGAPPTPAAPANTPTEPDGAV